MINKYFSDAEEIIWENGVRQYSSKRNNIEVLVSYIPPNTKVPKHKHKEIQLGMVIKGCMEISVGNENKTLNELLDVYIAGSDIEHGGYNNTDKEVIALDVKVKEIDDVESKFLNVCKDKELLPGMDVTFFVDNWIEIMIANIPANGGTMPKHKHKNKQIGVCIGGEYDMFIENEKCHMKFGQVYFCESRETHSAVNNENTNSKSINIFMPPRYNRIEKDK